jgi:lipopolysaccharide/colanic/teichoic acid biosynthesis glycosyltransferase
MVTVSLGSGAINYLARIWQMTLALLMMMFLLPLCLVIALLVWLGDGLPVLFMQTRIGHEGKVFTLYKFRSMRVGAELVSVPDASKALKPLVDERITVVGKWLRRFSLDELPQLLNVLKGEMAFVGPRPHLPSEMQDYSAEEYRRFSVKPGMTGLWQVSGRAEKSFAEQMALDLYYVDHASLGLDMWIIVKTIPAVVFGRGAY